HGWQDDLKIAIRKSMKDTMRTRMPITDQEVDDLYAFFATLRPAHSPHRGKDGELTESSRRGWATFTGKGGCAGCHTGTTLTSTDTYDVGTGSLRYVIKEFNPPSLRGLQTRRRFMHDGRAKSLVDVLTKHHRPENVAGEELNDAELRELLEYLGTL
ncbi:MAG: hypothetical protein NT069_26070, partial [Planctomycetota bacterium]|nr:hypothetical protein [Planctomycetota bacterium]